ncbi:hypothetical protein B0H13DRAFT_2300769 [Mycena leptocephala]|nr:hypothetical protein B0H13DRAFT_2300769 [Mycena leptocephala]
MPSKAKGGNVFRAGARAPAPPAERSSSPEWDLRELEQESREKDDGAGDGTSGDDADAVDVGTTADGLSAGIEDDNETGSSSPAPSVRAQKRPAAQLTVYRKKPRVTAGAQGLVDLNRTAAEFNEIMGSIRDIFASSSNSPAASTASSTSTPSNPVPSNPGPSTPLFQPSPQRHSAAIARIRDETWLGASERTALVRMLRDIHKVDEYNGVYDEEEM